MDTFLEILLPYLAEHLGTVLAYLAAFVVSVIYRGKTNRDDAVASIKSGVADFFQDNPEIKNSLIDGKITREEWALIFTEVGPEAVRVATRGGSKILNRWIGKGSVAKKYIEAVARELSEEFKDESTS